MTGEPEAPDFARLRVDLGLPAHGKLDRDQSLRLVRALDADHEPIPDHAWVWARRALGLTATRTA